FDPAAFAAVAPLAQTRIGVLSEIVSNVDFLFLESPLMDEAAWAKTMKDGSGELLDEAVAAFEALPAWDADSLKATLEAVGTARGLKLGKTQAPVRVAVTGRTVGLPLFESLEVLGRERTLTRMRAARLRLP
ncbi:MAG TPA: glutamate--tRNA ligase, partial [Micromonospora sp.]